MSLVEGKKCCNKYNNIYLIFLTHFGPLCAPGMYYL